MRSPLFFTSALALLAAVPAGAQQVAATDFIVRPGQQMRIVAINQSRGVSSSTTWVIVKDGNTLVAVDVQPSVRAEASAIVSRPGRHHATATCDNHIATIVSCTIRAMPIR